MEEDTSSRDSSSSIMPKAKSHDIQAWWNKQRQSETPPSAFDLLSNLGFNANEMFLSHLMETAKSNLRQAKPGYLQLVTQQCAHLLQDPNIGTTEHPELYHSHLVNSLLENEYGGTTEEDIMEVVRLCPYGAFGKSAHRKIHQDILSNVMWGDYSTQFKEFMFRWYPFSELRLLSLNSPENLLEKSHMGSVGLLLPRIRDFKHYSCLKWSHEGFVEFLRLMTTNKSVRHLQFTCLQVSPSSRPHHLLDALWGLTTNTPSECKVEKLMVDDARCPIVAPMLKCFSTSHLTLLKVTNGHLSRQSVSVIADLLGLGKLKGLVVSKFEQGSEAMSRFLDALNKGNSPLSLFNVIEVGGPTIDEAKTLLEFVKQNTSLTYVWWDGRYANTRNSRLNPISDQIEYFLELNRFGRHTITEPGTSLVDLVNLLCVSDTYTKIMGWQYRGSRGAQYQEFKRPPSWWEEFEINVLYSFLQEHPDKFFDPSRISPVQHVSPSRKRKNHP